MTYRTFQQRLIELQQAAVRWGLQHQSVFERAARKLGMLAGPGTLRFDGESEMDVLMDRLIYEEQVQGFEGESTPDRLYQILLKIYFMK